MHNVLGNYLSNYNIGSFIIFVLFVFLCYRDVVLYAASANRKYVDNIIKVLADVVLRPRITEDEVKKYNLIFLYVFIKIIQFF